MKNINKNLSNAFAFALFLSLFISLGVSFLYLKKPRDFFLNHPFIFHFIIFLVLFFISFGVVYFSIKKFNLQQVKRFTEKIPENITQEKLIDFEELGERITDYTHNKELELILLKDREKYRREFLGNVSHELKTPLFSIQGYVLTLIEGGVEDLSIRDKYLSRINKSVDRLIFIVNDLDLLNELESGNFKLRQKNFNIVALTQEVFDLLEYKAIHNKIELKFDKNYIEPIYVNADIEKIQQVLINLIANAISHSGKSPDVIVSFMINNGKVIVNVTDHGKGIPEKHLNRIFERFYRIEKARNRDQGGSGLGLSIVKHILEAHQEKISVESKEKEGTSFIFTLQKV